MMITQRHLLDIYAPGEDEVDSPDGYPVLIFVSGGGWTQGSKAWIANMGFAFAQRGIGVVDS